ncbi:ABC transporter permease [Microbacterium bovistercoris]|uniref:ABC transporter permease n=1 Tax=Microbacterium bovistercoris TaxID=2293570 RepID=A0A371NPC4_9MICO|nr:ABC transporter permease [Microbacterium bovistercoris]REJ04044.1 ABC transporter permease [Microbacterium bovistercoris]
MSVQTAPARRTHTETSAYRLSFGRALRSEWIKLATLRSTWWSIGITAVLTIGIAMMLAGAAEVDGIQAVVSSVQFTMLLAGILGAIAVTGEYSTGMIRSTLTAVPVRGAVLAAKAAVVAALIFVSTAVMQLVAALAVTPIVEGNDKPILWTDAPETWYPLLAAWFSMAVFALIGVSFGFILRSGAGAIASTVGLLFVLPIVVSMFQMAGEGWQWIQDLGAYLPMPASQNLITPQSDWGLEWPVALVTLIGWAVVGQLAAWAVLRVRDA